MTNRTPNNKKSDYQAYLENKHAKFNTPIEILAEIVESATGSDILDCTKVILGEVNEVYDIATNDGSSVVVRISRSKSPRFTAEKWAMDQVRVLGVPAPFVRLITSKVHNHEILTFCVEDKLPGTPVRVVPWDQREKIRALVVQSGTVLAKIHSIVPQGFGGLDEGGQGKLESWQSYIFQIEDDKEQITSSALKMGITSQDIDKGFDLLKKHQDVFGDVKSHLIHGDFSTKHILYQSNKITGILDFESCKGGDPMWDFTWWVYFFGKDLPIDWLKEGYSQVHILDPQFDEKIKLYKLRLGLSMINYYESENNIGGMRDTKEKYLSDLNL